MKISWPLVGIILFMAPFAWLLIYIIGGAWLEVVWP